MAVLSKEPLKTKRSKCSCGGSVRHYQNRFSTLTVYTEDGPVRCKHLEFRCIKCLRGYYFGYSSDVRGKDVDALEDSNKRAYKKLYEEDCLEQEVCIYTMNKSDTWVYLRNHTVSFCILRYYVFRFWLLRGRLDSVWSFSTRWVLTFCISMGHLVEWPRSMWPITLEDSLILSWMLPKILKTE